MKPRFVTHYLPLFDNSTDRDGVYRDRREEVVEGGVRFRRDGVLVLGGQGFGYTRPIVNYRFSGGCVANRDPRDQILCLRTPTGEEHRFRYVHRDSNWYRLVVVERAPYRLIGAIHAMREEIADFGPVLGALAGSGRVLAMGIWLLRWCAVRIVIFGLIMYWTRCGVVKGYGQLGPAMVDQMTHLLWFLELAVYGLGWLKYLAFTQGGRFFQVVLPVVSMAFLLTASLIELNGPVEILRTMASFRQLDPNQKQRKADGGNAPGFARRITTNFDELQPQSIHEPPYTVRP